MVYLALQEGTEESARGAVINFEHQLKVCEAIGNDEGIAIAKANIAGKVNVRRWQ
jgi:hypothetical protein